MITSPSPLLNIYNPFPLDYPLFHKGIKESAPSELWMKKINGDGEDIGEQEGGYPSLPPPTHT